MDVQGRDGCARKNKTSQIGFNPSWFVAESINSTLFMSLHTVVAVV